MAQILTDLTEIPGGASIVPQVATATVTGVGINMQNAGMSTCFIVEVGTVSGGAPSVVVKLQESLDNATGWTDIANSTQVAITAAGRQVGICLRTWGFVRAVATQTGAGNVPICVEILGQPRSSGLASGVSRSPSS